MNVQSTTASSTTASWWSLLCVVVVTFLLSALHLPYPFDEDQAMFLSAARELADGARMYGEFWDMKQPGIYWWYQWSGDLFGFDEHGIRLADMVWSIGVAALLWGMLRGRGTLCALLGPLLTFGTFYAKASPWHLSQVELLVCAPLALIAACLVDEQDHAAQPLRYGVVGAALAVTGVFKSMMVPVGGAIILAAFLHAKHAKGVTWPLLLRRRVPAIVAGIALVILPIALIMYRNGTLATALWTTLVYPGAAVREYRRHSPLQLMDSTIWFLRSAKYLLPWAAWAAWIGVRRGRRIEGMMVAWIAMAFLSISIQFLSYWEYHFDVFFVPVGVLAALGFVDIWQRVFADTRATLRWATAGALASCVALGIALPLARKAEVLMAADAFSPGHLHSVQLALSPGLAPLFESADAVRPLAGADGRIIVWGDPRMYDILGRRQLIEVDGGTIYLESQLVDVAKIIREQRAALIYMSKYRNPDLVNHGGGIIPKTVSEYYEPCYENVAGVWYRPRAHASSAPDPRTST